MPVDPAKLDAFMAKMAGKLAASFSAFHMFTPVGFTRFRRAAPTRFHVILEAR